MAALLSLFLMVALSLLRCNGEMFTALIHMEGLLGLERELLHQLNTYIVTEKNRLKELEEFSDKVERALNLVDEMEHTEDHLHDPVNAFQLTNRFTNGWMILHENVYQDNAESIMANISLHRHRFPTHEDYQGAMTALRRLQDTYDLDPVSVAKGNLSKRGLTLTSSDCYALGRSAYNEQNWKHTRDWMLAALSQYNDGELVTGIDLPSIYDHISYAEYNLGNVKKAAQYTRELLQYDPYHERALANKNYFERISREEPDNFVDSELTDGTEEDSEREIYEKLCREADPLPSNVHKHLICYYFDNKRNPRLILRPIKTEVAFIKPKLYIFHDFVSDAEIERMKELANPKLNRATVHGENGELLHATYRISKSGWLASEDDPLGYVDRIDRRIEDVTGLDMSTAEQLQVVNYGIGGHYEPHYDFARTGEDAFSALGNGNRVSTLLIYMSDVELGGATVFPLVGARLTPIKGAAAYWWNLKKSGEGDYSTRHAGCPVLVGSKWVCNKWIHERGQEFRRPCGLSPNQ